MKRNLFFGGILALVAFFVWSARKAMINLSVQQAQSITATTQNAAETAAALNANGFWVQVAVVTPYPWEANALATANAAHVTQSAVQAEADLQQAGPQLAPAAATQNAAAQQKMDQMVSGVATAIALTGLQARTGIAQRPEPSTVLWMWLTPIFILVAAVLTLWGVTRWLAQRQTEAQPAAPR